MDPAYIELIKSGGSVLIAMSVLVGILYLGHKLIWMPSQKQNRAIAEEHAKAAASHADAAASHAEAARSNQEAARFNSVTSEANTRTAEHLERLTTLVLERAVSVIDSNNKS
jgi:glutathione synthase/RimK-type ligase-like ATP-grasp enzyme